MEIRHRLDQIYGFRQFNYPKRKEEPISFGNMLATNEERKSDLLRKPAPAVDFANLLTSATGDNVWTESTATDEAALPLSSLPPFSQLRVLHVDPLALLLITFSQMRSATDTLACQKPQHPRILMIQ
jgi:hypothetical protein